ncbi:MAG: hypothetical protein O3A00_18875 [Planctomycetota bacterium]|nr:hypothetical protein [Planctomycetota bacterium]
MLNRRQYLKQLALTPALGGMIGFAAEKDAHKKLPIAAVVTTYHNNSHADVIIGKVLEGFEQKGGPGPDLTVASMYTDQVPKNDMSRDLSAKHGFPIFKTIDEAITLGTDAVQVAGVICVGEHGNYPKDPRTGQKLYPRRRLFDAIAATFRRCGKSVPVFSDKHLAYRWADARHMYQTTRELKIPFMAGSSLPVAWREPATVIPIGSEIEAALAVGYGGLESYGFHALETLQCVIERRRGGEPGVKSVQTVRGKNIAQAERDGRWSRELLKAALATTPSVGKGDIDQLLEKSGAFFLLDHRDGFRSAVAMANGLARHFAIAVKLRGQKEPVANWFRLQDEKPYGHFTYLLKACEHMVHTGRPAYPVERTLLTTGVLDAAMHSNANDGTMIQTPELNTAYKAVDWPFANAKT